MGMSSALSLAATVTQTKALDLTTTTDPLQFRRAVSLTDGTAAGQANKVFHDRRTLAASATEDLDLSGVLLDAYGAAITFARVKGLFISAAAGNTNNVIVGNATSNGWATLLSATGTVTLRPGASFAAIAGVADGTGYAVTAGTGDLLKVANSAGSTSVEYDIVIVGASA